MIVDGNPARATQRRSPAGQLVSDADAGGESPSAIVARAPVVRSIARRGCEREPLLEVGRRPVVGVEHAQGVLVREDGGVELAALEEELGSGPRRGRSGGVE